ncbi:MAG TPA: condensation domain-containing protein [Pseudonocardiaceae bacterium]|nr:condensation domain-containing protein [Pseudonocardiaceae bacterium]
MAETILVPFRGEGAGVDALSWGQWEIWRSMTAVDASLTLAASFPAAPGTTVAGAAGQLAAIMGRHQSLRTTIVLDADGTPRQHVATSGQAPLQVVDVTSEDAVQAEAALLLEHYERTIFDYPNEWPVRMAVVLRDGVPAQVVAAYSHIASDVHGLDALVADVIAHETGSDPLQIGTQPLDQVKQQRMPAAQRQNDAALRHAEKVLRAIPGRRFGESTDRREPRWWQIGYHSPASFPAVHAIAARNNVRTTPVLLAGFAVALCRLTSTDVAATRLMVSNRFRPGFASSVSPLTQSRAAAIEVADSTFDEVVARSWRALTLAGRHSYFDPHQMSDLVARVGEDRGEDLRVDVVFNDRRRAHLAATPDHMPSRAELAAARQHSVVRWERPLDNYDHTVFFHVNDVPDAFDYQMCADTHRVSPADMESMVRCVEDVLITAAFENGCATKRKF